MNEPLDQDLLRHFDAAAETPLPDVDFLIAVEARIHREKRIRTAAMTALYVALIVVAVLLTPYVVAGSLTVAATISGWLPLLGPGLLSPIGLCVSLVGAGWVLRRVGVLRR